MKSQIDVLRERVLAKKDKHSALTGVLELVREFGCFGDIVGRDFEVMDKSGEVVYTIRQKPMKIKQMNVLIKELNILKRLDNEREAAKWGKKR